MKMESVENSNNQRIYDVTVQIILNRTDREVTEEFVMAKSVTYVNLDTIEIIQDVVAPDALEAYRRACNLVSAVLDAGGLPNQYQFVEVGVQEVGI